MAGEDDIVVGLLLALVREATGETTTTTTTTRGGGGRGQAEAEEFI
jgi:hypothetical protein